jgi:hypothetical protein
LRLPARTVKGAPDRLLPLLVIHTKWSYRFPFQAIAYKRKDIDMAIKPTIKKRKKSHGEVHDLVTRKDPRGGSQKKEGPGMNATTRHSETPLQSGKRNMP